MPRGGGRGKTLRKVFERFMSPIMVEYFPNGAKYRAQNSSTRDMMSIGTTGNEGDGFCLESLGGNVQKHGAARAHMIVKFWLVYKMIGYVGAREVPLWGTHGNAPKMGLTRVLCKLLRPDVGKTGTGAFTRRVGAVAWRTLHKSTVAMPRGPRPQIHKKPAGKQKPPRHVKKGGGKLWPATPQQDSAMSGGGRLRAKSFSNGNDLE